MATEFKKIKHIHDTESNLQAQMEVNQWAYAEDQERINIYTDTSAFKNITIDDYQFLLSASNTQVVSADVEFLENVVLSGLTEGQVVFPGSGGVLSGDADLFWNNSTKQLGIGTASPGAKLDVNGEIRGSLASGSGLHTFFARNSQPDFAWYETDAGADEKLWEIVVAGGVMIQRTRTDVGGAGETWMQVDRTGVTVDQISFPNGNVGIGTASPGATLDVLGKIFLQSDGTVLWGNAADFGKLTWDTGKAIVRGELGKALSLGANSTQDYLYIATTGNVGIGTSSPSYKLQVSGDANITSDFSVNGNAALHGFTVLDGTFTKSYGLRVNPKITGLSGINSLSLADIGIGNSSATTEDNTITYPIISSLHLGAVPILKGATDTITNAATLFIQNAPSEGTNNYALFTSAGDVRFDGNVGIGTTSAGSELEVVGNIISKGTSWTSTFEQGDTLWKSVTYGNGLFVAVGPATFGSLEPRVMTSPDGINWTSGTAPPQSWESVTYGNGLFVAVGYNVSTGDGELMTSPDGVTWTSRTSPTTNNWFSVTYGNGLFVAVAPEGTGDRIITSPDGITWTSRTNPVDNSWYGVTYGNGLFVAVANTGSGDRVMTSTDGVTWTSAANPVDNNWLDVTYGNGLFVAVANSGSGDRVMTSTDGVTWTSAATPDNNWYGVTYGNGLFVAVGQSGSGDRVMTSPDGVTWTSRTNPVDNNWNSVTYGNGRFVAVAVTGSNDRVMYSGLIENHSIPHNNIYQGGMSIIGNVGIGTTSASANADLTLDGGVLNIKETTTPTADTNYGKIYTKSDNKIYFQDGAGVEHEIAFV